MLNRRILVFLGIAVFAPGCSLLQNSTRTLIVEPLHYCNVIQEHRARANFRATARDVWDEYLEANPDESYSADYASGFQEGFADYLYAGGSGEPPPVPPRRYWKNKFATPQGRQAIEDWFAGFRHGAGAAQLSGCRCYVEVPSSISDMKMSPWPSDGDIIGPVSEPVVAPAPDSLSTNKHRPASDHKSPSPAMQDVHAPIDSLWSANEIPNYQAASTVAQAVFVPDQLETKDIATKPMAMRPVRLPPILR